MFTDEIYSWNDSTDDDSDYQTSLSHSRRMTQYSSDRRGGFGSSSVSESFLSPPPRHVDGSDSMRESFLSLPSRRCSSSMSESFISPPPRRVDGRGSVSESLLSPLSHHCSSNDSEPFPCPPSCRIDGSDSVKKPRVDATKPVPSTQGSAAESVLPPPPFSTPPKLHPVEFVMQNHTGSDIASLRILTTALAREAIFGREELAHKSLSGRRNTSVLEQDKLDYIKTLVRSRVPNKSAVEFEHIWTLCRGSLSKSCQALRTSAKRKI